MSTIPLSPADANSAEPIVRPENVRRGPPHVYTVSGQRIDLEAPQPQQIEIEDIAHSLAHLCRFNGHVKAFYSVAQHSVRVADFVVGLRALKLQALLHDAHEAYLGDVIRPLKRLWPEYASLAEQVQRVIHQRLGLAPLGADAAAAIAECDEVSLYAEAAALVEGGANWPGRRLADHSFTALIPLSPADAKACFLERFRGYGGEF